MLVMLAVALVWPAKRAPVYAEGPIAVVAPGPGGLKRLARLLTRPGKPPARNGRPRGGKANHARIHTETYGEGSITGPERDWGQMTPEELEFARDLAQRGVHIRLVPTRRDRKTPDFEIEGSLVELKTLQSFGKSTVRRNIETAVNQNAEYIIINCKNVDANRPAVERQIRASEANLKRKKKISSLKGRVLVWMPDGSTLVY